MLNPLWNRPVHESDRSLDPLGMNRVTDRLLNDLLMGITTVTPRARYYSFYTWVVYDIGKRRTAKSFPQFRSEFYNLERVFMMACVAHEQDPSSKDCNHKAINGSEKGRLVWRDSGANLPLEFPYFGNKLGGYGQYYQGSISNLALTGVSGEAAFEQPTDLGLKIAEAFDKVVKRAEMTRDILHRKRIAKKTLSQLGKKICLCRLRDSDSADRNILRGLFFGLLREMSVGPLTLRRRKSLALVLFCSECAANFGFRLSDQDFQDACYFEQMQSNGRVHRLVIPQALAEIAGEWKVFRAHDYFAYCCETVLSCFLEFLGEKPHIDRTLDDFLPGTISKEFVKRLSVLTKIRIPNRSAKEIQTEEILNGLTSSLGLGEFSGREVEVSEKFDAKIKISSKFSEFHVIGALEEATSRDKFKQEEIFPPVCALLTSIYLRFFSQHIASSKPWRWMLNRTGGDLSPVRFVSDLRAKIDTGRFSLVDFMRWFTEEYVVEQATHVHLDKSESLYSKPRSWFHKEGAFFKRDRGYRPDHRNTRFYSATTILEDLGLVEINEDAIELSRDGKRLLADVVER